MLLRFAGFAGANKALHPLLLPDGVGVDSLNHRPGRGDLRPWRAASTVATVSGSAQTIYRMGRTAPSDTTYWLQWTTDVDVARGFIATDTSERTYWTGDGVPKWTDTSIGLGAPPYPDSSGVRILGVPIPNATPSLAEQVAGVGDDETRAYVVTWVNDRGEESAPSPAGTITCKPGATIRVTRNASVPTGAYGLATWRIYRTVAGGENDYYFVAEATAATALVDTTDATLNLANPLLSETWIMPPADLKGLKALWNGIMAGFVGKSLRFCEPYRPYAWPIEYELILDEDIVALARWGQQLIVLTVGKPYVITGSTPEGMLPQLVEFNQACVAKKGVVEFGFGVAYPSPDGLAFIGAGGPRVLTEQLAQRADWQAFVPSTFVGANVEGAYIASYDTGAGRTSVLLDPLNPTGFYFCEIGFTAAFWDPIADTLYVLDAGNVKKWDSGSALTASHESRTERVARPTCFAFGQVVADAYPVTLSMWAQGVAKMTNYSVTGPRPFRLPAGFKADEWRVKVSTTSAVQALMLAHSIAELNAT
jgi:hypothetical protein